MKVFPHPLHAVIFDMDGLLLDTECISQRILRKLIKAYGAVPNTKVLKSTIGQSHSNTIKILQKSYGPSIPAAEIMQRHESELTSYLATHTPPLKRGASSIIGWLAGRGIKLALATSSPTERAEHCMRACGLYRHFTTIVGGDMVSHPKPHPQIYLHACSVLKCEEAEAVVLEDSMAGAQAALSAKITTIVVTDMLLYTRADIPAAYTICSSLPRALRIFKKNLK